MATIKQLNAKILELQESTPEGRGQEAALTKAVKDLEVMGEDATPEERKELSERLDGIQAERKAEVAEAKAQMKAEEAAEKQREKKAKEDAKLLKQSQERTNNQPWQGGIPPKK